MIIRELLKKISNYIPLLADFLLRKRIENLFVEQYNKFKLLFETHLNNHDKATKEFVTLVKLFTELLRCLQEKCEEPIGEKFRRADDFNVQITIITQNIHAHIAMMESKIHE